MSPRHPMNFDQQDGIFDPDLAQPVTVLGAGSVGSQVVCMLPMIGCTDITVWDGDFVVSHNIPMSQYEPGHVGHYKMEALSQIVTRKCGVQVQTVPRMWNGEPLKGTVVCCVDSMDVRMAVWERVRNNPLIPVLIDIRVGIEFIAVYSIVPTDPAHKALYEKRLYPSAQAAQISCGNHGIIYVSGMAACAAMSRLTSVWKGSTTPPLFEMQVGCLQQI